MQRDGLEIKLSKAQSAERTPKIIHRGNRWWDAIVPIAVFGFAWGMGHGPFVAIGGAVAAALIVALLRPRGPTRWTE